MKILISGSRTYKDLDAVKEFVRCLPNDTILLNGRAIGVDNVARNQAQFEGLVVLDYPAEWNKYGKSAGMIRNHVMVDLADEVYCFWDGESRGTKDVVDYAKSKGKLQKVFYADGSVECYTT